MKTYCKLLLLCSLFLGCSTTDDDTSRKCKEDCTTINGKVVTLNNEPVPGVKITFSYWKTGMAYSNRRKIIEVYTDKNGEYNQSVYLEDEEISENAKGYFSFVINDSKLDGSKYIKHYLSKQSIMPPAFHEIRSIRTRDTVISNTFYIPQKSTIRLDLNQFVPQHPGDEFAATILYPAGVSVGYNDALDSPYQTAFTSWNFYRATNTNNQFTVEVAKGEKNIIEIYKLKNGVIELVDDYPVDVPVGDNSIVVTFDY